jgi:hypothetical protein
MANVKVQLLNTIIIGSPGENITAFGHAFTIQPDGTAHAYVDEGFVKAEVAAGRYRVIDGDHVMAPRKDLLAGVNLGFEITNLFGTNDINKLNEQIRNLTDEQIRLFASTRLELNFPDSMSHKKMVNQIMKITRKANPQVEVTESEPEVKTEPEPEEKAEVSPKSQNEILDELNKLEKDMKK